MENFLYQEFINDLSICDDLIEFYHSCEQKGPGLTYGSNGSKKINLDYKESFDVELRPDDKVFIDYFYQLQNVTENYIKIFPTCNYYAAWGIREGVNIQHYPPMGGFKVWHTERGGPEYPVATRHLVFMTYLNDVTDCGETEFLNQKIKISPKKGLTLIWPADWTYTHRGIPSPTQDKFIITGWFNYFQNHEEN